jgi:hypothetical protein
VEGYSQSDSQYGKFIYGKLVGDKDTLQGYIKLSDELSSMGQRIYFKSDKSQLIPKYLYARDYVYFESDSLYSETHGIATLTGDIYAMLPRIINGKLQVFEYALSGGPLNMFKMEHYYFIRGEYVGGKVTRRNFKRIMPRVLADNQELINKIESGELTFSDFKNIILQYNAAADNKE